MKPKQPVKKKKWKKPGCKKVISKSKNGLALFGKGLESGSNRLDW